MYINKTFQDFQQATDKKTFVIGLVEDYLNSSFYKKAVEAEKYARANGTAIESKTLTKLQVDTCKNEDGLETTKSYFTKEKAPNIIPSDFFNRFVTQESQHLLANGLIIDDKKQKEKLGTFFDDTLNEMGENSLIHGVCYGFWNFDHMEMFKATEFVALIDEEDSSIRAGVRFWRLSSDKPMYYQLFEEDGMSMFTATREIKPKTAYKTVKRVDALSEEIIGSENYSSLPIIPMWANQYKRSELTPAIKNKIDLYDRILSDFGDNLDRTNDIYWVLNNYQGTTDEIKIMLAEINELKATYAEGDGATATPHTIEVPYAARQTALEILRNELYKDFMAVDLSALQALTATEIKASYDPLEMKVNKWETQVRRFVIQIMNLAGLGEYANQVRFERRLLANQMELTQMVIMAANYLDRRTILTKLPFIEVDEIDEILQQLDVENTLGGEGLPEDIDTDEAEELLTE